MPPYTDWALTPCQAGTMLSLLEALISRGPSLQQPSGAGCVITSQECGHSFLCCDHPLMARSQGQMTQVTKVSTHTSTREGRPEPGHFLCLEPDSVSVPDLLPAPFPPLGLAPASGATEGQESPQERSGW